MLSGPCWVCQLSAVTGEDERVSMFSLVELAACPPRLFSTNKRLHSQSENKERAGAAEVEEAFMSSLNIQQQCVGLTHPPSELSVCHD